MVKILRIKLSLNKHKRLKHKKLFDELFNLKQSKSVYSFPFKIIYVLKEGFENSKFGLSVPKRNFKLAVTRNLLKRRIKEAYRTNQADLNTGTSKQFILFYIYTAKKVLSFNEIEKGVKKAIQKLNKTNELDKSKN